MLSTCHSFEDITNTMLSYPLPSVQVEAARQFGVTIRGQARLRKLVGLNRPWQALLLALVFIISGDLKAQDTLVVGTDENCTYSVRMTFQGGTNCANQTPPTVQSACYLVNSSTAALIPVPSTAPVLRAVEAWCNGSCSGSPSVVWGCANGPSGTCTCGGVTLVGDQATGGFRLK